MLDRTHPAPVDQGEMLVPRGQERVRQKQLLRIDPSSRDGVRSDMSLLENASVSGDTKESYRRQMGEFMKRESVGNINCHASELDQKLVSHFDRLYLEGKGFSAGQKLLAALLFFLPVYGAAGRLNLPRAQRALRGWKKRRPGTTRRPLPWCVICGIALDLTLRGFAQMALCWLLMVDCYLRPSECVNLTAIQVVARQKGRGMSSTALHLNPDYLMRPSKTGELDESVLVSRSWIGEMLEVLARRKAPSSRMWSFDLAALRQQFLVSAAKSGVKFLKPVLYMGRHSGASLDRLEHRYSLEEVRKRGRWRSAASVSRYEKRALVQDVLRRMRVSDRAFCQKAERVLKGVLKRGLRIA